MVADLPLGFSAGTAMASFKKKNRDDLGIIFSDHPCVLAAMFTQNIFCAAPVQVDKKILNSGKTVRAIIANSGQANACTGKRGLANCEEIQKLSANDLNIQPDEILLISTGVIGTQFDMDKWKTALPKLTKSLGSKDAEDFTRSFMTTDAFPKFAMRELLINDKKIKLTVMAKGAGMICPNMATMLCTVLTDAKIQRELWQDIFNYAVNLTFNRVTVDGDTSTNDTILGLANGASGVTIQSKTDINTFRDALTDILYKISYMLVKDGEGAKKVIHIMVTGAMDDETAEQVARSVGNSQLVKTAIYGGDANWGRIINAVGYSGARVKPDDVTMSLCGIERFKEGQPVNDDKEDEISKLLENDDVEVKIELGHGTGGFTLLASDLGHEYVTLNSDYRS